MSKIGKLFELCKESNILKYYNNLNGNNSENFLFELNERIHTENNSMIVYYRTIVDSLVSIALL